MALTRIEEFGPDGKLVSASDVDIAGLDPTAEEKLARARTVLEQIGSLPAPVLTADVVDLLDDLGTVL